MARLTIETANIDAAVQLRDVTPGEYVRLSVTDSGAGMSDTVLARAFDPFFTTKPIGQVTGLGLSMVYGFARQSEGHARIASAPGAGTTVQLYLPRFRGTVADAAVIVGAGSPQPARRGETVLVIEDEASVRELVTEVLNDLGYRPLEAADGPSGLAMLRQNARIDLLVTDVGLPGMNSARSPGRRASCAPTSRCYSSPAMRRAPRSRTDFSRPAWS
jgi:hypothetical protein